MHNLNQQLILFYFELFLFVHLYYTILYFPGYCSSWFYNTKKEEGQAYVTCVLFDHENERIFDHVSLEKIEDMNESQYYVRGCTALYDAIGSTIQHIKMVQKYMDVKPDKTIVVITTDGMENSSREYTASKVKKMVESQKEEGWEFLFLGANLDAVSVGKGFGIEEDRSVTFECDSEGTQVNYCAVSEVISTVRKGKAIKESWSKPIQSHYKKSHK